jgi:hypothetical protein
MTCINLNSSPYLNTYNPRNPVCHENSPSITAKIKHDENDYDFYYIQFSNDCSFSIFSVVDIIPKKILKRIRQQELFLVLDNSLEYFVSTIDTIYKDVIIKCKIPAEQVVLLTSVPNMIEYVSPIAKQFKLPSIKVEWFPIFERVGKETIRLSSKYKVRKPLAKKAFLSLNRRWRLHRPMLVAMLYEKGLIDDGYVSLGSSDDNRSWEGSYDNLLRQHADDETTLNILKNAQDVTKLEPMYLDTNDLVTNQAEHSNSINRFYQATRLSVVTETTYYENVPFFSEKIFKTIAMKHPFIIATAPKSLQYLKELGYKTYHPYIDESYDDIENHGERMIAIVNEIERISKLSGKHLKRWRKGVTPIVEHNFRLLDIKELKTVKKNF